jgi:hypothetical protein
LKEALQDSKVERHIERVAKPWGVTLKDQGKGSLRAGQSDLEMLKGEKAKARQLFKSGVRLRNPRVERRRA